MRPSGIEPATFRFVAQYLNHWSKLYYIFLLNTLVRNLFYAGRKFRYMLYEEFGHCAMNDSSMTLLSKAYKLKCHLPEIAIYLILIFA
jgi:hypothetical protein